MISSTKVLATSTKASRPRSRGELPLRWFIFVMNMPTIAFVGLVLAYPIIVAAFLSFHHVGLAQLRTGEAEFIGLGNFIRLFQDDLFLVSLRNTLYFVLLVVPAELLISLVVALLINRQDIWSSRLSRVLVLVPYAIPPIASGMIWAFIFDGKLGYLNRFLYSIGAIDEYVNWLAHSDTAIYAVAVAYIWRTVPFSILLVYAALQGIPKDLYEAGEVDGCGPWQKFRFITLPLLRPVIAVTLIFRTTFAIMVFEEVMAITQGGPGDATFTAAWFTYRAAFSPPFDLGLGSAAAYVMALIVAFFGITYFKFVYKRLAE